MKIQNLYARHRGGMSPLSQIAGALGRTEHGPKFTGVKMKPDGDRVVWDLVRMIAGGEYDHPGFLPAKGETVIDIGANVGVYALWAEHLGASVTAYEPNPDTFASLQANTAGRNVSCVQAAVVGSCPDGDEVRLYLHDERSTRHSLIGREIESGKSLDRYVTVPAHTIDRVLEPGCDLLKVDCEGGEYEIFEGAEDRSLRRVRRILLEFHRSAGDPSQLSGRLEAAGFSCAVLEGADPDSPFGLIGATQRD